MSYYSDTELAALGWKRLGRNVRVSRKASIYNPRSIEIGDDSRIDDFCLLSAGSDGIAIGRNVHLAAYSSLIGAAAIALDDFAGLSSRVSIYSSSDDYSGRSMTNPTVPVEFTDVRHAPVRLARHTIVGAGSVILPGVTLHEGCAVGALSLVRKDCDAFGIYAGNPARRIGTRLRDLLELEARFLVSPPQHSPR
jgi:acetyltransferase-like isoleucine patch superfamily enzyme